MGSLTRTLIYQGKSRRYGHKKHMKEAFPNLTQIFLSLGHAIRMYYGCITNKAWELGTVKDWPQNLIRAAKSRTAEFQAQSHFKSLRCWLEILLCYDSLGICECMNSSLRLWIPCMFLFIVMALMVFKRLSERPALESVCKRNLYWAGWETHVQHNCLQKWEAQVRL